MFLEVQKRHHSAYGAFHSLKCLFSSKSLSRDSKFNLYNTLITVIVFYGSLLNSFLVFNLWLEFSDLDGYQEFDHTSHASYFFVRRENTQFNGNKRKKPERRYCSKNFDEIINATLQTIWMTFRSYFACFKFTLMLKSQR